VSVNHTTNWFQALPSTDLSLNLNYGVGIKGNSPVPGGGNQQAGNWSIKLTATYRQDYTFALAYNAYFGKYNTVVTNPFAATTPGVITNVIGTNNGGNATLGDRDWLSFTFKTNF
jgi:hypothetical protein